MTEAKLTKEKGNYKVIVPIETKEVPVLDKDKNQKLDEDGEPIFKTEITKSVTCEINVTFDVLKKAHSKMTKMDKKGNFLGLDTISPGEEILTYGGVQDEGWKKIMADPMLKMSASISLFSLVQDIKVGEITKN